jgi:hypothetical protein
LLPILSVQSGIVIDAEFNEISFAGLIPQFFENGRDYRTGVVTQVTACAPNERYAMTSHRRTCGSR